MIGIEPEVIERAPANRIRVLILRKRLGVPGDGIARLSDTPWRAVVTMIVLGAVICPAGLLRRRVKSDIAHVHPRAYRHAE